MRYSPELCSDCPSRGNCVGDVGITMRPSDPEVRYRPAGAADVVVRDRFGAETVMLTVAKEADKPTGVVYPRDRTLDGSPPILYSDVAYDDLAGLAELITVRAEGCNGPDTYDRFATMGDGPKLPPICKAASATALAQILNQPETPTPS